VLFPESLRNRLSAIFEEAFEKAGAPREHAAVVVSQKPELGDFQCNGAMPSSKALKRNPREIADAAVAAVGSHPAIAQITIAGPGFINIRVADEFLAAGVESARVDGRLGLTAVAEPIRMIVDFGGPNVAKPMHVGHLRSTIIGDALQRLFKFLGHDVLSDIHLGDWGTQMGMLIEAVKRENPLLPYFKSNYAFDHVLEPVVTIDDLQRMYPEASALCKSDPRLLAGAQKATAELQGGHRGYRALWRHFVDVSNAGQSADFEALGVRFDQWFGESRYDATLTRLVDDLRATGHVREDAGALIIDVAEPTDKAEIPPMLLVKSDGGFLYATTDMATIAERVGEFRARLILYVVDKRQSLHFVQLFRAARKTGLDQGAALEHLPFGTMNGSDGTPFKTRSGGVMRLRDLIDMMTTEATRRMDEGGIAAELDPVERAEIARRVGIASLKYADLQNPRANDYIFDPEKFTRFEGRTGAYLCYAAVRIKSILRNAGEKGFQPGKIIPASLPAERALQLQLALLPDAIASAAEARGPHHLAGYAYDLAQVFNQFYNQCHILSEDDPARRAAWLGLVAATLRTLETVLGLLAIEAPERM